MTTTVPCVWCATPTAMLATRTCDRCYELYGRICAAPELALRMLATTTVQFDLLNLPRRAPRFHFADREPLSADEERAHWETPYGD